MQQQSETPQQPVLPSSRPSFRAHLRRRLVLILPLVAILILSIAAFGQQTTVITTGASSSGHHQRITLSQPNATNTDSDVLGKSTETVSGNSSQTSTVNTSQTSTSTASTDPATDPDDTATAPAPTPPTPTSAYCTYCYYTEAPATACPNYCVSPTPTPGGCGVCGGGGVYRKDMMCPMVCMN